MFSSGVNTKRNAARKESSNIRVASGLNQGNAAGSMPNSAASSGLNARVISKYTSVSLIDKICQELRRKVKRIEKQESTEKKLQKQIRKLQE